MVAAIRKRMFPVGVGERERAADAGVVFGGDLLRDGDPAAFARARRLRRAALPATIWPRSTLARAAGWTCDHPDAAAAEVEEAAMEGAARRATPGSRAIAAASSPGRKGLTAWLSPGS